MEIGRPPAGCCGVVGKGMLGGVFLMKTMETCRGV